MTRQTKLLCFVTLLLSLTPGNTILTPNNAPQFPCIEKDLKLTCECNFYNKALSVPSFQQANVHNIINRITIQNCHNVTIGRQSIVNLKSLRYFDIINVENLHLSANSLEWRGYVTDSFYTNREYQPRPPSLSISIIKTKIVNIEQYAIMGQLAELKFNQVRFERIQPFAFSSISKMSIIDINNCTFKQIDPQAFKKIETDNLIISNSHFIETLPSRTFTDIDVLEQFKIANCNFGLIDSTAFIINLPTRVTIVNSKFDSLSSESFKIRTRGPVTIKNNVFRHLSQQAFIGYSYIKEHRAMINQEIIFDQNTINELGSKPSLSFNRTSFSPKYGLIIINITCDCLNIEKWVFNNEWREQIYCIVIDNRQSINKKALDYKSDSCDRNSSTWIILVSVFSVLLVVLIIVAVVVVLLYHKHRQNKLKEYVNRGHNKTGSLGMVVPDGRTYRETEVHVIVEKAELLTTEL